MDETVERDGPVPTLTARSVLLSVLLGSQESGLPARDLVRLAAHFDVSGPTARVALSRLVASGDLEVADSVYSLSARHRSRRQRQDEALHARPDTYDGTWRMVVVTGTGRDATHRAALRRELSRLRFGELREGVWMRPGSPSDVPAPSVPGAEPMMFTTRPDDDRSLASSLWDLQAWSVTGHRLLARAPHGPPPRRFGVNAAIVRHLQTDPGLPAALLPSDWPGEALRRAYSGFRQDLAALVPSPAGAT